MLQHRAKRFRHDDIIMSESDSYYSYGDSCLQTDLEIECMQKCNSCEEERDSSSFCKMCYEKVSKAAEEYKREIEDLKAKNNFLRLVIQTDHNDLGACSHGPGFTDVVLVLVAAKDSPNGGQSEPVPTHRAILASRSPVFKAMFENEMEEGQSGTIKISEEVSHDALRAFVNYLYSAEACLNEQIASDVLVLAEKYQVQHLKAYCGKFLASNLNWDNSITNYAFAHQHNVNLLKEAALSLIMDNMDNLQERQEYSELVEKNPRLVVEIYEACHAKLKKG